MFGSETPVIVYFRFAYVPENLPGEGHAKSRIEYELQLRKLQKFFDWWLTQQEPPQPPRVITLGDLSDTLLKLAMQWWMEGRDEKPANNRKPTPNTAGTVNKFYRHVRAVWNMAWGADLVPKQSRTKPYREIKRLPQAWHPNEVSAIVRASFLMPGPVGSTLAKKRDKRCVGGQVPAADFWPALVLTELSLGTRISATMDIQAAGMHVRPGRVNDEIMQAAMEADRMLIAAGAPSTISLTGNTYAPAGGSASQHYGNINVVKNEINGVDILVPTSSFGLTIRPTNAAVTQAYEIKAGGLVGSVNNATFRGRPAGEVLFAGLRGGYRSESDSELRMEFFERRNRTGITIGVSPYQITGIVCEGWDYLWVEELPDRDGMTGRQVVAPLAVYIERVYPRATRTVRVPRRGDGAGVQNTVRWELHSQPPLHPPRSPRDVLASGRELETHSPRRCWTRTSRAARGGPRLQRRRVFPKGAVRKISQPPGATMRHLPAL